MIAHVATAWAQDPTVERFYAPCGGAVVAEAVADLDQLRALLLGEPWGDDAVRAAWARWRRPGETAGVALLDDAVDNAVAATVCRDEAFWVAMPRLVAEVRATDGAVAVVNTARFEAWGVGAQGVTWSVHVGGGVSAGQAFGGTWRGVGWGDVRLSRGLGVVGIGLPDVGRSFEAEVAAGVRLPDARGAHDMCVGLSTAARVAASGRVMLWGDAGGPSASLDARVAARPSAVSDWSIRLGAGVTFGRTTARRGTGKAVALGGGSQGR